MRFYNLMELSGGIWCFLLIRRLYYIKDMTERYTHKDDAEQVRHEAGRVHVRARQAGRPSVRGRPSARERETSREAGRQRERQAERRTPTPCPICHCTACPPLPVPQSMPVPSGHPCLTLFRKEETFISDRAAGSWGSPQNQCLYLSERDCIH